MVSPQEQKQTSVLCICPRCGEPHKVWMYWTGHGMPRVFCSLCKTALRYNSFEEYNPYLTPTLKYRK
jgi:hypothetical protein